MKHIQLSLVLVWVSSILLASGTFSGCSSSGGGAQRPNQGVPPSLQPGSPTGAVPTSPDGTVATGNSNTPSDPNTGPVASPSTLQLGANSDMGGFRPFPNNDPWNLDISQSPVDPNSATYINTMGVNNHSHADFGTVWNGAPIGNPYVVVSGSQTRVPVSFTYASESDPGPYPIPSDGPIEGGPSATGDRHVIVVDRDNLKLYELYRAFPDGSGGWKSDAGAIFDLVSGTSRPAAWTSADAAGLPIFPGLARYDEVMLRGVINHALRFTASRTQNGYVWPARHAAGTADASLPPMGLRVRLKANYDVSWASAPVQVVLRALKKYGMILADNGPDWMIAGSPNPAWNDSQLHDLSSVPGSAFEVVQMGPIAKMPY